VIVWRFSVTVPWYFSMVKHVWDSRYSSAGAFYVPKGWNSFFKSELRHFLTLSIDYAFLAIVAPWPWTFFFERPGNPTLWRIKTGFQDLELIVRKSRGWTWEDLIGGDKKGEESPFWKTRVVPYVGLDKMSKTGYLMMDANWDLDFAAMTSGQKLLGKDFKEDDLNGKVFCWYPEGEDKGKWIMWDFRKQLYPKQKVDAASPSSSSNDKGDVEEGRRMITRFREKLVEMDKEDLFYKWVELIQYESSRPGGFTRERQEEAGAKVKQLFVEFDVDFEEFEKSVGIRDGKLVD